MDFQTILQVVHFVLPAAMFGVCLRVVRSPGFRPVVGLVVASFLGFFGLAVNGIGAQLDLIATASVVDVMLMKRETIWHGTTLLAIAYGLGAFCAYRLLLAREFNDQGE